MHYVSICSPNYLHDAHCRLALRVGADVICEKPLVINPWNLDPLQELEQETGRRINTVLQLRLHPHLQRLRECLQTERGTRQYDVSLTYITSRGHFCHIMAGATIGERCSLGQNVFVANDAAIGNNVKIQNNVSVYAGVELEDDVFCGPSCVFTNVVNPRSQIIRRDRYLRTVVRRGATIGANATIICGATIGRYAFIGAGAVVLGDVLDYALMLGVPARQRGWMSRHGHRLPKPDADGIMICEESGWRYREVEPGVVRCLDWPEDAPLLAVS